MGAINLLALDDLLVEQEGEPLDPERVQAGSASAARDRPLTSGPVPQANDALGKKWIIVIDADGEPHFAALPRLASGSETAEALAPERI